MKTMLPFSIGLGRQTGAGVFTSWAKLSPVGVMVAANQRSVGKVRPRVSSRTSVAPSDAITSSCLLQMLNMKVRSRATKGQRSLARFAVIGLGACPGSLSQICVARRSLPPVSGWRLDAKTRMPPGNKVGSTSS